MSSVVMGSWNMERNVTVVTRRSVLTCAVTPGQQGTRTKGLVMHTQNKPKH